MTDFDDEIEVFDEQKTKSNKTSLPVFLIVLVVLSALNIVLDIFPIISGFFKVLKSNIKLLMKCS